MCGSQAPSMKCCLSLDLCRAEPALSVAPVAPHGGNFCMLWGGIKVSSGIPLSADYSVKMVKIFHSRKK